MSAWRAIGAGALLSLTAACATSNVSVVQMAPAERPAIHAVKLVPGAHAASADFGQIQRFESTLRDRLYAADAFETGDELTIEYSFLRYDNGTQVKGYVTGAGKDGDISVLVRFLAPDGGEIAKIIVDEKVEFGRFNAAVSKAADQAADYAISQFKGA